MENINNVIPDMEMIESWKKSLLKRHSLNSIDELTDDDIINEIDDNDSTIHFENLVMLGDAFENILMHQQNLATMYEYGKILKQMLEDRHNTTV